MALEVSKLFGVPAGSRGRHLHSAHDAPINGEEGSPGNMDRHDWRKQSRPSPLLPTTTPLSLARQHFTDALLLSTLPCCSLPPLPRLLCCPPFVQLPSLLFMSLSPLVSLIFTVFSFSSLATASSPLPSVLSLILAHANDPALQLHARISQSVAYLFKY